jgi:hypothetical protein
VEDLVAHFAGEALNREELNVNRAAVAIVVPDRRNLAADRRANPELLIQLSRKRLFRALAGLDLCPSVCQDCADRSTPHGPNPHHEESAPQPRTAVAVSSSASWSPASGSAVSRLVPV